MPSTLLNNNSVQIQPYDVVGEYSETQQYFVYHVGLAIEAIYIDRIGQSCEVAHMKPPLELRGQMQPHVYGTANLTADEIEQIKLFHNEIHGEYESERLRVRDQYQIHPAIFPVTSSDGTTIYYRFSCSGFAKKSYLEVGIDLVNNSDIPTIDLSILIEAYPVLQETRHRELFGLDGDGPWPVLLCGYLLHAFNRSADEIREIPYEPSPGDEIFPHFS